MHKNYKNIYEIGRHKLKIPDVYIFITYGGYICKFYYSPYPDITNRFLQIKDKVSIKETNILNHIKLKTSQELQNEYFHIQLQEFDNLNNNLAICSKNINYNPFDLYINTFINSDIKYNINKNYKISVNETDYKDIIPINNKLIFFDLLDYKYFIKLKINNIIIKNYFFINDDKKRYKVIDI
jgi:hypothetical protein